MPKTRNRSVEEKSSARLAAVQCLYQIKVMEGKTPPERVIQDVLTTWEEDAEEETREIEADAEPDAALLKKLVIGALSEQKHINDLIVAHLSSDWKLERMSPILVSILQAATFELAFQPQLSANIIVDEYVTLTRGFFGDAEIGFVHGILQKLAKKVRD